MTWSLEDCLNLESSGTVLVATVPSEDGADRSSGALMQPMTRTFDSSLSLSEVTAEDDGQTQGPLIDKTVSNVFYDFRNEIDDEDRFQKARDQNPSSQSASVTPAVIEVHDPVCSTPARSLLYLEQATLSE